MNWSVYLNESSLPLFSEVDKLMKSKKKPITLRRLLKEASKQYDTPDPMYLYFRIRWMPKSKLANKNKGMESR